MSKQLNKPNSYVDGGLIKWGLNTDQTKIDGRTVLGGVASTSGAGAIPLTATLVKVTTTGADALTLADGVEGQVIIITMVVDGGNGTLTPANLAGGTTITFDAVGDTATLVFDGTNWNVAGISGAVVA